MYARTLIMRAARGQFLRNLSSKFTLFSNMSLIVEPMQRGQPGISRTFGEDTADECTVDVPFVVRGDFKPARLRHELSAGLQRRGIRIPRAGATSFSTVLQEEVVTGTSTWPTLTRRSRTRNLCLQEGSFAEASS
ncbi:PREDICTED: uncharacterized protein LOC106750936 isoform X2 [Dinoponera quadriceps]|uniref:Uncharacterized protein LOC106750936 isoform X2 n=1 Tax=Dinoponera quadriceps TaxID=609295 RepID=A0A6P3YAU5_DINQU|nr:PREDICTED: uncharacterized protein LOC106750936 isoform X2 [Dinoponera quadriceps]